MRGVHARHCRHVEIRLLQVIDICTIRRRRVCHRRVDLLLHLLRICWLLIGNLRVWLLLRIIVLATLVVVVSTWLVLRDQLSLLLDRDGVVHCDHVGGSVCSKLLPNNNSSPIILFDDTDDTANDYEESNKGKHKYYNRCVISIMLCLSFHRISAFGTGIVVASVPRGRNIIIDNFSVLSLAAELATRTLV